MALGLATTGTLTWTSGPAGSFTRRDVHGHGTQSGAFAILGSNPMAAVVLRQVLPDSSPAFPLPDSPPCPGPNLEMLIGDPSTAGLFSLLPPVQGKPSGVEVCWTSMADRLYAVERCTNLSAVPCFVMVQHGVLGQTNTTCFTDQTATNHLPSFYRVRVER